MFSFTKNNKYTACLRYSIIPSIFSYPIWFVSLASKQLCTARASWSSKGITVAGLSNNLPSTTLSGLRHPSDIYVYANGTLLIADTDNNRIVKWNRNAKEGVLIAGTGSYGSWNNLLAKPTALTGRTFEKSLKTYVYLFFQ